MKNTCFNESLGGVLGQKIFTHRVWVEAHSKQSIKIYIRTALATGLMGSNNMTNKAKCTECGSWFYLLSSPDKKICYTCYRERKEAGVGSDTEIDPGNDNVNVEKVDDGTDGFIWPDRHESGDI